MELGWFADDWCWYTYDALATGKMQSCPIMSDLCLLCFPEDTLSYTKVYRELPDAL